MVIHCFTFTREKKRRENKFYWRKKRNITFDFLLNQMTRELMKKMIEHHFVLNNKLFEVD
jgi:hypothetical protein